MGARTSSWSTSRGSRWTAGWRGSAGSGARDDAAGAPACDLAGGGACAAHRAPRSEARERVPGPRRRGGVGRAVEDPRLRDREAVRRPAGEADDADRDADGDAGVHVARAVPGAPGGRPPLGCLLARLRAVPSADRAAAVRWRGAG